MTVLPPASWTLSGLPTTFSPDRNWEFRHELDAPGACRTACFPTHLADAVPPDSAPSGLLVEAFNVPGKAAWHMEGEAPGHGDTIGVTLRANGGGVAHVVLTCVGSRPAFSDRLRDADVVLSDCTLWRDDEMIAAGLSQ